MGEVMKEATFSLAEANFAAGDFRYFCVVRTIYVYMYIVDLLQSSLVYTSTCTCLKCWDS